MSRRKPRSTVGWHSDLGEVCTGQARVINISDAPAVLKLGTEAPSPPRKVRLEPGQVVLVPMAYAIRLRNLNAVADYVVQPGDQLPAPTGTRPSIVEQLSGGRVLPIDDPRVPAAVRTGGRE